MLAGPAKLVSSKDQQSALRETRDVAFKKRSDILTGPFFARSSLLILNICVCLIYLVIYSFMFSFLKPRGVGRRVEVG